MNLRIFITIGLIASLFFDSTIVSLPLVFALGIFLYVLNPKPSSLVIVFIAGIILDMLRLTPIGSTSLFLLISCGLIYLYRNTFELKDMQFIILPPFIFAYIYAISFGYNTNPLIYLLLLFISEGVIYYFNRTGRRSNLTLNA